MTARMKRFILIIVLVAAGIVLGTVIDYMVHESNPEEWGVPPWYYRNKMIFGTFWGAAAFLVARRWWRTPLSLALATSAVVAVALQTRYFFEGYPLDFVFLFMGLHFLMFLFPLWALFAMWRRVGGEDSFL